MSTPLSRDEAWSLLCEWTESDSLRRHMLAVEAAMRAYAERLGGDPDEWGTVGLLHDADYERFPDLHTGHPREVMAELERRDAPPEWIRAIAAHAEYMQTPPETPMERTLVAVDELCGFLSACAYVRPDGIHGLTPKSVKKKLKQPSFAAAVSRDDVRGGAELLGVDFDEHVAFVIAALEARADELAPVGTAAGVVRLVVLEGDETGQELLEAALGLFAGDGLGVAVELERFDLSLASRRETGNAVVQDAAAAMRAAGYGLKAATITPEGADDVGSPNRLLREAVGGKVIVRTGRRIPGVVGPVAGVHHPISIVRMAVGDAYGAAEERVVEDGDEVAVRTERISRSVCRAVAEFAFREAERAGGRVYGGPKWTVSPLYEGMLKEEMDAAASRRPGVDYRPVLIDALYAGLISGAADAPLFVPSLNRDGDCLSDLVMPMFGSIAGAESVLLAFDEDFAVDVAMAEAPHGTAPTLFGKDLANPMAMLLACAALLGQAGARGEPGAQRASRAVYEATLATVGDGCRTVDLGGHAGTTEFAAAVVARAHERVAAG